VNPSPSPARWPPSYSRPGTQPTSAGYTTAGHPGAEQGGGEPLSLPSQVAALIQQARDPANLCRIYHGWSPWC